MLETDRLISPCIRGLGYPINQRMAKPASVLFTDGVVSDSRGYVGQDRGCARQTGLCRAALLYPLALSSSPSASSLQ